RRLGEAGARALPRSLVREPAGAARHVRRRVRGRPDHEPGDARSDPRRYRPMSSDERQGDEMPAIDPALEQGPATSEHGTSGPMRPTDELTAAERQALIASMSPEDAERVPELHEVDVPPELREKIEEAMGRYPQLRSASIPALWAVQRHYGWCSPEGIRQAAAVMGLTPAYLQSVASFYDLFRL